MAAVETIPTASKNKWLKRILFGGAALILIVTLLMVSRLAFSRPPGEILLRTNGLTFSETELEARAGEPVNLELFNVDGYEHAFEIDEFNVHVLLPGSETANLTFTPTEPGTYTFYCGVYGHREAGMVGTLVVAP